MDVGTAIHEAFQEYIRVSMFPEFKKFQKYSAIDHATATLFKHFPWNSAENKNAQTRTYADSLGAVAGLIDKFENGLPLEFRGAELCTVDGKPSTEIKFEIFIEQTILPEFDVYISGALDLGMYIPALDVYSTWDIKTHKDPKQGLIQIKYENDNQCLPYHMIFSHIADREISRFIVGYLTVFIDASEPQVQFIPYQKEPYHIEEYLLTFKKLLHQIRLNIDSRHWPRRHQSCVAFNSPCSMLDICRIRGSSQVHQKKRQDFLLPLGQEPYYRYESEELKPDVYLEMKLN